MNAAKGEDYPDDPRLAQWSKHYERDNQREATHEPNVVNFGNLAQGVSGIDIYENEDVQLNDDWKLLPIPKENAQERKRRLGV